MTLLDEAIIFAIRKHNGRASELLVLQTTSPEIRISTSKVH